MFRNSVIYNKLDDGSVVLKYTVDAKPNCVVVIPTHAVNDTTKLSYLQTVVEHAEQFFAVRAIGVFSIVSYGFTERI